MKRESPSACVFILCLFCVLGECAQQSAASDLTSNAGTVASSVPRLVRFNGTLQDGTGKPFTGPVEVTFELFPEQSGGEPLWWETQTVDVDAQGRYSVLLGAMHPGGLPMDLFTGGEARWLGVAVGKIEQPRVLLVSVPYALKAGDAETLGGKPATAYVAADQLKDQVESEVKEQMTSPAIGLRSVEAMVTNPSSTPQAITETSPSTFTCSTTGNCVTVTQNGAGHALSATSKATSGIAQGVRGESLSPTGRGVYGVVNQPTGVNFGVRGDSASTSGRGVLGYATAATGLTYGLYGLADSNGGVGLLGHATSATGATMGLRGIVSSPEGTAAVFENRGGGKILSGRSGASLVEKFAVDGNGNLVSGAVTAIASSPASIAGIFDNTTGGPILSGRGSGVQKFVVSATGWVIAAGGGEFGANVTGNQLISTVAMGTPPLAVNSNTLVPNLNADWLNGYKPVDFAPAAGSPSYVSKGGDTMTGTLTLPANGLVAGTDQLALASSKVGIGTSSPTARLHVVNVSSGTGQISSSDGVGAECNAYQCMAVHGAAAGYGGMGLSGYASGTQSRGVYGFSPGTNGFGVLAGAQGSGGTALFAVANGSATQAGTFNGNVTVNGNLDVNGTVSKNGGSFKIDHPLDPANKFLYHSFVESPDMKNVYDGVVALDAEGEAWVRLPEWFQALNSDFRYQLTAIGQPLPRLHIAREIAGNRFKIAGGRAGAKVSWMVTGIRQDAYAKAHRIPVEEEKRVVEKGY